MLPRSEGLSLHYQYPWVYVAVYQAAYIRALTSLEKVWHPRGPDYDSNPVGRLQKPGIFYICQKLLYMGFASGMIADTSTLTNQNLRAIQHYKMGSCLEDAETGDIYTILDNMAQWSKEPSGFGSMSVSLYDTAWVACITKVVDGSPTILFPESASYILDRQDAKGGWAEELSSKGSQNLDQSDEVITTLAALHALCRFRCLPEAFKKVTTSDLTDRIQRASTRLGLLLSNWDTSTPSRVGFEIIVPSLLELLGTHGFRYDFPAFAELTIQRKQKILRLDPQQLYQNTPSTLLHSLEAFFGDLHFDFDQIRHHKICGSMMGSPSATAAYLMRASVWDEEAEHYLRQVIDRGAGLGTGGVPSAFPSANFELSWALSTILTFENTEVCYLSDVLAPYVEMFSKALSIGNGLLGFAPGFQPDLDDSSRAQIILSLSGRPQQLLPMISYFRKLDGQPLSTYIGEKDASVTANCNALIAMMRSTKSDLQEVETDAKAIVKFLWDHWHCSSGTPSDKWNTSPFYCMLLATEATTLFLERWKSGELAKVSREFVHGHVLPLLMQCLAKILSSQAGDGSWGTTGPCEESAYAILSLHHLRKLGITKFIEEDMKKSIRSGQQFLRCNRNTPAERIWIEKVLYGSELISQAYRTAALNYSSDHNRWSIDLSDFFSHHVLNEKSLDKFFVITSTIPTTLAQPRWLTTVSYIQGQLFMPKLSGCLQNERFKRHGLTEDKYKMWIPFLWTLSNNLGSMAGRNECVSSNFLFKMMELSVLNFRIDEHMETVVGAQQWRLLCEVGGHLDKLVGSLTSETYSELHPQLTKVTNGTDVAIINEICGPLADYAAHVVKATNVVAERKILGRRIRQFFQAHIDQEALNLPFRTEQQVPPLKEWLYGPAATNTSCPLSLDYALIISGGLPTDLYTSYVVDDLGQALAIFCRLQNDIGSALRDASDGTLNACNFTRAESSEVLDKKDADEKLLALAEYEEKKVKFAISELGKHLSEDQFSMIMVFRTVTKLFGEVYMVKDLASRRV